MARPYQISDKYSDDLSSTDLAAIILTFLATFLITAPLSLLRAFLFVDLFTAYVRASGSVMVFPHDVRIAILLFDMLDFGFAIVAGAAAMTGARFVFPNADPRRIIFAVTSALLIYAIIISLLPKQLPGIVPTRLDLATAVPGWFLGYLASGGSFMRKRLRWFTVAIFLIVTIFAAIAVGVSPAWVRFNMPCGLKCGQIIPWMEYGPRS